MSSVQYKYGVQAKKGLSERLKAVRLSYAAAATATLLSFGLLLPIATSAQGGRATGPSGVTQATGADLQISGSASTNAPDPGAVYTYTYKIKNSGPLAATEVVFTSVTPSNTTPNYATLDGSTLPCANIGNNVDGGSSSVCNIGTLAKGAQASVVVSVTAPQVAQTVSSSATVTSSTADPVASNNTSDITITVKAPNGGVCKGGVCDTVPTAVAAPCAKLTSVTAPVGYYLTYAAIWNDFTIQSCSTSSEAVSVQVQEINQATNAVDYDVTFAASLVPSQNMGMVLDNDFAAYSTIYTVVYTVRDSSGNVLDTASVVTTTPPQQ